MKNPRKTIGELALEVYAGKISFDQFSAMAINHSAGDKEVEDLVDLMEH